MVGRVNGEQRMYVRPLLGSLTGERQNGDSFDRDTDQFGPVTMCWCFAEEGFSQDARSKVKSTLDQ